MQVDKLIIILTLLYYLLTYYILTLFYKQYINYIRVQSFFLIKIDMFVLIKTACYSKQTKYRRKNTEKKKATTFSTINLQFTKSTRPLIKVIESGLKAKYLNQA